MAGHLLGFDVGSSSVKASIVEIDGGAVVASAGSPDTELAIDAPQAGWAEQHPDLWWEHMRRAVGLLREGHAAAVDSVAALGISYQMHGLVIIDKGGTVLRPSIIWCDSRAVPFGDRAFSEIGEERCLRRLLNSPGNFTAAKLAWVKENEPEIYRRVWKMMLPGDYLAYRMTGELVTTPSGLSEGILWDSQAEGPAGFVLDHFGFDHDLLPHLAPSFAVHGRVTGSAASELGIPAGVPVSYRGGDQPNNALSLSVLDPGEMAATAGTSGVVYGVVDHPAYDPRSRVNTFVHVNHSPENRRYGVLLCLNGTGICNRWLKQNTVDGPHGAVGYDRINEMASAAPIGSDGVVVLPFGNGAERTLESRDIGASVHGLNFNRHSRAHLLRAGQEGIVFALAYGVQIMREMGLEVRTVKAGRTNMFQSDLFRTAFATTTGATVELYDTDGSAGAARGAGIGAGVYATPADAFGGMVALETTPPDPKAQDRYDAAMARWTTVLNAALAQFRT
ncbi:MAG: FGGY family carbohydrate kinase [Spirochaetia bacterium]